MPRIERDADISWEGNVARGAGTISAVSGAFSGLGYSLPTRVGQSEGKTSPEELLAAAHGGCFTMSLASELVAAGHTPGRLDVHCKIVMNEVEGQGHQILESHITAVAAADGLDDETLQAASAKADESCPFSALLKRAGTLVAISSRLA